MITFDPERLQGRLAELEQAMGEPGFWDDQQSAARVSAEHARLSRRLERYDELSGEAADLEELLGLASDDGELEEVAANIETLGRRLDRLQEESLFTRGVRRGRRRRLHPCGHGRHRRAGLDRDAPAHVPALGRRPRLSGPS